MKMKKKNSNRKPKKDREPLYVRMNAFSMPEISDSNGKEFNEKKPLHELSESNNRRNRFTRYYNEWTRLRGDL